MKQITLYVVRPITCKPVFYRLILRAIKKNVTRRNNAQYSFKQVSHRMMKLRRRGETLNKYWRANGYAPSISRRYIVTTLGCPPLRFNPPNICSVYGERIKCKTIVQQTIGYLHTLYMLDLCPALSCREVSVQWDIGFRNWYSNWRGIVRKLLSSMYYYS